MQGVERVRTRAMARVCACGREGDGQGERKGDDEGEIKAEGEGMPLGGRE